MWGWMWGWAPPLQVFQGWELWGTIPRLDISKGSPRHEATGQGVCGPRQGQGSAHTGGPHRGSSGVRGHSSALISLPPPPAPLSFPSCFPSQI